MPWDLVKRLFHTCVLHIWLNQLPRLFAYKPRYFVSVLRSSVSRKQRNLHTAQISLQPALIKPSILSVNIMLDDAAKGKVRFVWNTGEYFSTSTFLPLKFLNGLVANTGSDIGTVM